MTYVAVIIISYRNVADARECIAALARSTHRDMEIHVCENGGVEAFEALCLDLAKIVEPELSRDQVYHANSVASFVRTKTACLEGAGIDLYLHQASKNLGYAGGINAVLAYIADRRWDAVWILNPDTAPAPGALAALVERAATGNYGVVGSRLILENSGRIHLRGGRWRRFIARGYNIGFNELADDETDTAAIERDMNYVAGTSMFVTRAFIEDVGSMDESYFLYVEEVDWCFRRGSYRLGYAHDSVVLHKHGTTIGSNTDLRNRSGLSVYLDERNKLLFTRRFFPILYPVVICTTLVLTLQYLKARAFKNFRLALNGWVAGIRGERGVPARFTSREGEKKFTDQ
jgi:N-acetylglucosaminyl-diphospho-decaprenol L-rhamnosyltransferase